MTHNMARWILKYIIWLLFIAMISVSAPASDIYASEPLNMEPKLKAAFIYNFAKFVDWPVTQRADISYQPFVIGIFGHSPIVKELLAIEGKPIKGRKLEVRLLSNIKEINDCNVVFISASEENNLMPILSAAKSKEILTVSDMSGFVEKGGIIGFVRLENKLRFDINLKTAEDSSLKIRSDLLTLARKIKKE
uniref:Transmembrane protein n=2 Tax=Desulfobacterium TaxID=2295 RepID=E1YJ12_9BACT|nr:hypothetical protein N47_E47780 [uncultured Desulfobacterium sp.]